MSSIISTFIPEIIIGKDYNDYMENIFPTLPVIADNKLALNSNWDIDRLKIEIDELEKINFDLDILGFSNEEIEEIMLEPEEFDKKLPEDFKEVDEQQLDHCCPKCGFEYDL